ncbi:MAG: histidine kinase dimerization/phospho-acceptor domain-containing protein, partial [Inhella sp.]
LLLQRRRPWDAESLRLLETCATLLGSALERIHYTDVARSSAVEIETERLRNTLLATISHDLRTPLTSLVGLAESLHLLGPLPRVEQREIAHAIAASARRMSALVHKLLDMARLESGQLSLKREWLPVEEWVGAALAVAEPLLAPRRVEVDLQDDL